MTTLIGKMFRSPEAQPDVYAWAAVALAHAALGTVLVALACCLPLLRRHPALVVTVAYGLIWEGG